MTMTVMMMMMMLLIPLMQVRDDDGDKTKGVVAMTGDPKRAFADKVGTVCLVTRHT